MNTLLRETDNTVIRTLFPRLVLLGAFRTCLWTRLLRRKALIGISNGYSKLGVCVPFANVVAGVRLRRQRRRISCLQNVGNKTVYSR